MRPSRILLVGMMGVGKTTVGALVAGRLEWCYLDSDAEIIRTTGLRVPDIFKLHGEAAFRAEESRVLSTRMLVAGLKNLAAHERPSVLVSQSATGYYGAHGDERKTRILAHQKSEAVR